MGEIEVQQDGICHGMYDTVDGMDMPWDGCGMGWMQWRCKEMEFAVGWTCHGMDTMDGMDVQWDGCAMMDVLWDGEDGEDGCSSEWMCHEMDVP